MELKDLGRFAVDAAPHATGRMMVTVTQLAESKLDGGNQRSLSAINVTSGGKNESAATENGIKLALKRLTDLKGKSEIVKLGVVSLEENKKDNTFESVVQLGFFDKSNDGADLIKKKCLGFGSGKTADAAEEAAIKSALSLMGEK